MAVWGDISIVSFEPSNHIVSTVSSAQSVVRVRFTQPYCTVGEVRWELRDGVDYSTIIHSETYVLPSSSVTKSGDVYTLEFDLAPYVTASTEYNLYLYAYPVGEDSVPCVSYATAYAPPTVSIVSPANGASIATLPLGITWSVTDSTGIAYQNVQLWQSDEYDAPIDILYNSDQDLTFDQDTRALALGQSDLYKAIENNARYLVMVHAYNGVGLVTGVQHAFTTSWQAPASPTASVTVGDADASCSITVTAHAGTPATASITLARVLPDGTRYVIADNLTSGDTVTDRLPPIGVEFSYEVIGVAATGVPSVSTVEDVTIESSSWAFNFGTDASECLLLAGNPRETYSLKQGGELYHFAGRQLPEWYGTQERDISGLTTFDTVLWHDADTLQDLCMRHHHGWYRDPFGHRYRAHMVPKVSHGVGEVWQLSIDWDVVEWQEAE